MRQRDLPVLRRLLTNPEVVENLKNGATAVRRRIAPAAPFSASAAAYVNFGNMDVECKSCHALQFAVERKVGNSEANLIFSNCFQGETLTVQHIPLLPDPPSLLREVAYWVHTSRQRVPQEYC